LQFGELLTMPLAFLIVLATTHLEDAHFVVLAVSHHGGFHRCTGHQGGPDLELGAVANGEHLVGTPLVSGASVKATVVAHGKHDKVRIFKMRRRKHYQKRQGHRQQFTELQIASIQA